MNKPQSIHQALQTIDDINAFIQALRAATHEDDIKAICESQIAYILSQGRCEETSFLGYVNNPRRGGFYQP
jgi:hypothetical protein